MTSGESTETGTRMRAVVQHEYGGPETLHLGEIERPVPGAGQVLVEVRAAGVERGVEHLRTGVPLLIRPVYGWRRPKNPVRGREAAGVVAEVGEGVTRFAVGDEVFGVAEGTFAEYAVGEESKLAHLPAGMSFIDAAALPISGITALQGLLEVGGLEAGQDVLVIGASGGVGSFAVQIAHATGATVTGVCSGAKADLVRSLGADHVIDHTSEDFATGDRRYDLVFDIGGNSSLRRLRRVLRRDGTLVLVGGESAGGKLLAGFDRQLRAVALSPFISQRLTMFVAGEDHERLEQLASMVEQGQLRPAVGATYELADAPQAMRDLAAGRARGKLVVTI
ncbi:MAG TPA: NAD(P)-dependent alcohol dehydrogenase [Acidimicrobiales bacterium]|nr:NAD(P)-dependent alcohol dehydrogenase [Acidimicrobiales bacterium]